MPPDPSPEDVAEAVDAVFADPAFARGLDTTHMSLDELGRLLEHQLSALWREVMLWLQALAEASPVLYYLIMVGLLLALGFLVWHMVWTLTRAFRGSISGELDAAEGGGDAAGRARRYRDLRAEADRLASAGTRREAVHTLLLALLALLAEEQVLNVARSWTPREVLGRLEGVTGGGMGSFRSTVEGAVYGSEPVSAELYTECERVLDGVVGRVRA